MFKNMDVIICDIQDIGVRYFTYTWTVSYILEAAGKHGIEVIILDRPNPLDGVTISGPPIDDGFESFVGRFPIPVCHGMTLGELAQMINDTWNPIPAKLTVVHCERWQRTMIWNDTKMPWTNIS